MATFRKLNDGFKNFRNRLDINHVFVEDGKKWKEKTESMAIFGGTAGVLSSIVALSGKEPRELIKFFKNTPRIALGGVFGALAGATYVYTVHTLANYRKTDGPFNHLMGGLIAGFVVGAKTKSQIIGWRVGVPLALVSAIIKAFADDGVSLLSRGEVLQKRKCYNPEFYRKVEYFDPKDKPSYRPEVGEVADILSKRDF